MKTQIGGHRLGSGNKMEVNLRTYDRSTHDLGYLFRTSAAAGTLIPFMVEIALPDDTFDIKLDADVRTNPTLNNLYGSLKMQLDVFEAPIRLYNAQLHNNQLSIGMNMKNVQFPLIHLTSYNLNPSETSWQINPSCILNYLGIVGLGQVSGANTSIQRNFNAMPLLAYWDIFKNYYSNKQETNAYVIHNPVPGAITVTNIYDKTGAIVIPQSPTGGGTTTTNDGCKITFSVIPTDIVAQANTIRFVIGGARYQPSQLWQDYQIVSATEITFSNPILGGTINDWDYMTNTELMTSPPTLAAFPLANIDSMRDKLLKQANTSAYIITQAETLAPYNYLTDQASNPYMATVGSQEGLAVKTYQSDLFNNWIQTAWITGASGVSALSAVDTSSGSFTIDQLNLAKKVYDMLNRIAISGGSYKDWIDTVYTANTTWIAQSPMYHGGLSKEILFQEVIATAASTTPDGQQALGQQAARGVMGHKHKGGEIRIKASEPSYIMGLLSITPRIDYSQGNKWIGNLYTMDDLHKPALDEIGFQDLITDQLAYWDTICTPANVKTFRSAGKQPAWINYMTNVNKIAGNFAIPNNQMQFTLNRLYTKDPTTKFIQDLTTYIDPAKYNFMFAQTSRDAQNYQVQIAVNITARRKMSAKIMPNL